ncbi:MAG TPA: nickel-responsive transcriptional regulator NikR [Phycisphaerae bacterium]|nr:nickel-responsive transcriptional regulator NikR [Phycisphaerae bacterium]
MSGTLVRFGVSMDERLLKALDGIVARRGYTSRSEALRDLVRGEQVREAWEKESGPVVGTLTLIYDHHVRELNERLVSLQHDHHGLVHSTMHVHLSHRMCLEVVVLNGKPQEVQRLSDRLIAARGVKHGRLVATSGEDLV